MQDRNKSTPSLNKRTHAYCTGDLYLLILIPTFECVNVCLNLCKKYVIVREKMYGILIFTLQHIECNEKLQPIALVKKIRPYIRNFVNECEQIRSKLYNMFTFTKKSFIGNLVFG